MCQRRRCTDGGGHHKPCRTTETRQRSYRAKGGCTHIHTAIDACSTAYSEFAGTENTDNGVAFLNRAIAWFAERDMVMERVLTDNGNGYRSIPWRNRCIELGIKHSGTRP